VKHLIALFQSSAYLHETVILSCHGAQERMHIPELEVSMPYHKKLTPEDFATILHLKDQVVINTGCCLGSEKFAESFLARGAKAYIGAIGYIEGNAILPFLTLFFYLYVCKKMSLDKAFKMAQAIDVDTSRFKLLTSKEQKH